jgi:glutamate synthase (NADPH/NADH) small chain
MACAQQLARAGHDVVLFEKSDRIGGLLRYGIPDFKMEKHLIDRRMAQMSIEGVEFRPNTHVGVDVSATQMLADFDAIVLTGGAEAPRDLDVPGRELAGVMFAMEFLPQQNKVVAGDRISDQIMATGKHVVVIGGGDTGSDCVGTSNRHRAASITQFELLPQPPESENKPLVWPNWPIKLRTSSSHEEGCERDWAVTTKRFEGRNGKVEKLIAARVEWQKDVTGAMKMVEVPGSEFELKADLVLLAMGFVGPAPAGLVAQFGVTRDARSNVKADTENYQTSVPKVFAAGDMRRGQSLVVWAIREGRQAARAVDEFLMGSSELPR